MSDIDSYKESLVEATKDLKNPTLTNEKFHEVKTLVTAVFNESAEVRDNLKDELDTLEQAAKSSAGGLNEALKLKSEELVKLFTDTRSKLATLQSQVTPKSLQKFNFREITKKMGDFAKKIGSMIDGVTDTLAFTLGGMLGTFGSEKGLLADIAKFIGGDKMKLSSALSAQRFESIEKSKDNIKGLMNVYTSRFATAPAMQKEVFFAKLAEAARKGNDKSEISYEDLIAIAKQLPKEEPVVAKEKEEKTKEEEEDKKYNEPTAV